MLELRASHLRRNNSRKWRSMAVFDSVTRAHDARQHCTGPQAIPADVPLERRATDSATTQYQLTRLEQPYPLDHFKST